MRAWPAGAAAAPAAGAPSSTPQPFSFERLVERARTQGSKPHVAPREVAPPYAELGAEQWRKLRFRPEEALWRDWPAYQLQLTPAGWIYRQPVSMFLVEDGQARAIVPKAEMFDLADLPLDERAAEQIELAGLQVHYPLHAAGALDQLLIFLGASYFRAIGRGTRYGASARGLALETGLGKPEEFPSFRELYIQRPQQPNDPLTIYALLDSPSVCGAYRFDIVAREFTRVDVDVSLFFRAAAEQVGLAPLTSMYLFGPNDRVGVDDFRPAVHDSNGLLMWTAQGEVLWRPLANPTEPRITVLMQENPRGFGLEQRARDFAQFEDLERRFDLRPNLWVEPRGSWGKGSVRMIEVPIQDERRDNVVAFWTPEAPVTAGQELRLAYGVIWSLAPPIDPAVMRVRSTRIGEVPGPDGGKRPGHRRVVIEFSRPPDGPPVAEIVGRVSVGNGKIGPVILKENSLVGTLRCSFDVEPVGNGPLELRAHLAVGDRVVSEIWINRLDKA